MIHIAIQNFIVKGKEEKNEECAKIQKMSCRDNKVEWKEILNLDGWLQECHNTIIIIRIHKHQNNQSMMILDTLADLLSFYR